MGAATLNRTTVYRRQFINDSDVRRTCKLTRLSTVGDRAFSVAAARLWNSFPMQSAGPAVTSLLAPRSPRSVLVLNHVSSQFLISLSDYFYLYSARAVTRHFGHHSRF